MFLVPSDSCDFGVVSPLGSGKKDILYSSAALSAAKFLTDVRGLPLSDIEIECGGRPFRILRKNGRCGVATDRFSFISSCRELIRSAELKTTTLRSPLGKIKVCKADRLFSFCEDVLPELTLSCDGDDIIGSVVFEEKEGEFYAVSHFCRTQGAAESFVTAVAVASYIYSSGRYGELAITVRGTVYDIALSEYGLLVLDRHPAPLTLYAPDIE